MFNENNIVLNWGVLSDIHISGLWGLDMHENKFRNAIDFTNKTAGGRVDAFLFNGDFTDAMNSRDNVAVGNGRPENYEEAKALQNSEEFRILRNVLNDIDENIDIVYTLGNHDCMNNNNTERFVKEFSSKTVLGDNENYNRMYRNDVYKDGILKGMRHCIVGGYHILCIDMFTDYTESADFLKKNLDEITSANPEKFVFVMFHCKTPNTVFQSNGWGRSDAIGEVLKNYPQVVLITGHTHTPLQNERSIWQGEYTAVEASCIDYVVNNIKEENVIDMSYTQSQGLLMQIDDSGNLRILRLDFANHTQIKNPWIIPSPKSDGSHLSFYTNKRINQYAPPQFKENCEIKLHSDNGNTYIEFPPAEHTDMVYRYEVAVTEEGGQTRLFYISSLFCYNNPTPEKVYATLPYAYDNVYRITVTPQDVWFNCGNSLTVHKII